MGKEVELAVGESFELQLPEKRTAGYKWKLLPSDQSILMCEARVKEDNVPRTAQGGLIAGGSSRPLECRQLPEGEPQLSSSITRGR